VEFNSGTAQKHRFEPFKRGRLLHITTASKAKTVYRGPAAKWDRDFFFSEQFFNRLERFAFHFQIDFDVSVRGFDGGAAQHITPQKF
jgi:hypothetical protein